MKSITTNIVNKDNLSSKRKKSTDSEVELKTKKIKTELPGYEHKIGEELTINLCDMSKYIDNIEGMKKHSASPSDNWFIEFKNNIKFNGKEIKYGVLKLFINPDTIPNTTKNNTLIEKSKGLL